MKCDICHTRYAATMFNKGEETLYICHHCELLVQRANPKKKSNSDSKVVASNK